MQIVRLKGPFRHDSGHAFTVPMPPSVRKSAGSHIILLEGDEPIGPGESPHDIIRSDGAGRFSVWPPLLYFSASDNSDPNINGREYRMVRLDAGPHSQLYKEIRRSIAQHDTDVLRMVGENLRLNNSVFSNFFRYHRTIMQPLRRNRIPQPASVLEVGCGRTPYTALRFLSDGVTTYVANDIGKVASTFERPLIEALIGCLAALDADLGNRLSVVLKRRDDGNYEAAGLAVFSQTPCEEINLPEPVEFITSTSVLEHVTKPDEVIASFARLLAPGGLMWHSIDLRDHQDFSRPFEFLYKKNQPYHANTENRLRSSDWFTLLAKHDFETVECNYLVQKVDDQQSWTFDARQWPTLPLPTSTAHCSPSRSTVMHWTIFRRWQFRCFAASAFKARFRKACPRPDRGGHRFPACAKLWHGRLAWTNACAGGGRSEKIMLHQ